MTDADLSCISLLYGPAENFDRLANSVRIVSEAAATPVLLQEAVLSGVPEAKTM